MGCGSSSVVPLADSDIDEACGIKVRVNPSTPERPEKLGNGVALHSTEPPTETLGKDFKLRNGNKPPPLAFEVPIFDNDGASLIKKHPPRRFRRLGESGADAATDLNHETLDERQKEAERRRQEILSQRVMSAKARPRPKPLIHSDAFNQDGQRNIQGIEYELNLNLQ